MNAISVDVLNSHSLSPEEKELQKKLKELGEIEAVLTQRELDLATLHAELAAFEREYLRIVGVRYMQLDEVRARIAEARSRLRPWDQHARKEAEEAAEQARASAKDASSAAEADAVHKFTPSDDLKKLYREMARMMHPDLATDEQERQRRHNFMVTLNLAYEQGDEARMRDILQKWQTTPQSVRPGSIGDELVRVIRQIAQAEERIAAIDEEIESLEDSERYQLCLEVENATEVGRDLLAEMASEIDKEIFELKAEGFDVLWQVISGTVGQGYGR